MKEKLVGFIFLFFIITIVLVNLLNSEGLSIINDYNDKKVKFSELVINNDQSNEIWVIQIATYRKYQNALILAKEIDKIGLKVVISPREIEKKMIYRVRVLPKHENDKIEKTIKKLEKNEFPISDINR
jgi:hypothetical protein